MAKLMTVKEAARETGLQEETIWRKVRAGAFPGAIRLPGSRAIRIQRAALTQMLGEQPSPPKEAA